MVKRDVIRTKFANVQWKFVRTLLVSLIFRTLSLETAVPSLSNTESSNASPAYESTTTKSTNSEPAQMILFKMHRSILLLRNCIRNIPVLLLLDMNQPVLEFSFLHFMLIQLCKPFMYLFMLPHAYFLICY